MATGSVETHLTTSMSNAGGEHSDNSLPSIHTSATPAHFPITLPRYLPGPLPPMPPPARETESVFVVDDHPHTVIDLTVDEPDTPQRTTNNEGRSTRATRPPNFDRDIIDVDALPDRPPSPEVEVTFSRPAPPRPRRRSLGGYIPPGIVEPHPDIQDRWTLFFRGAPRNGQGTSGGNGQGDGRASRPYIPSSGEDGTRWYDVFGARHPDRGAVERSASAFIRLNFMDRPHPPRMSGFVPMVNGSFTVPQPDYEEVALRDPQPTYDPPEPAREGFTRSPKEGDTIVCPNCDDELGTGDTEEKRSVFFVRGCGHVSLYIFIPTFHPVFLTAAFFY